MFAFKHHLATVYLKICLHFIWLFLNEVKKNDGLENSLRKESASLKRLKNLRRWKEM
jgi:hypothetical protein